MFKDGQHLEQNAALEFDLAIVGAGMAGITLAERLRATGKQICLIESGGVDPEAVSQRLFEGENVGRSYFELSKCRFRVFGGSSIRWGGWARPLDPVDFTARDWIPHSGWPIDDADLASYYSDAARIISLKRDSFAVNDWSEQLPAPALPTGDLEPAIIQHGRGVDFGEEWRDALSRSDNVTVLLHANVTELVLTPPGDRLDHARCATLRGRTFTVRARNFVLAAGGIENARLMLASRGRRAEGVGNEYDQVGRCFMEHLHLTSGYLLSGDGAALPPFFEHGLSRHPAGGHGVVTPTAAALAEVRLPSCSVSLSPPGSALGVIPRLNWPSALMAASETAARRLHRRYPTADAAVRRAVLAAWRTGRAARLKRQAGGFAGSRTDALTFVHLRAEQVPSRDSRVTLAAARDALGVQRIQLDWRLSREDLAGVSHWTKSLAALTEAAGLGRIIERDGWEREIIGGPHHMGTTRMSRMPAEGVVDADCRVHSVENLYVAGSSVFTTAGHANPSFTILALTLRLADHLRGRLNAVPGASRDAVTHG